MIRKAIVVVLLAGASLIVWLLSPYLPSFLLTLVLLTACVAILIRRPVQRHHPARVGIVVGIILGIAATYTAVLAPLPVSPTTKFFLWPSTPGVALLYVMQGSRPVHFPGIPVLAANVVMYSFSALVVAGVVEVVRRLVATARSRNKPGAAYCPACQYNLTGNVSGVCPECGTKIERMP